MVKFLLPRGKIHNVNVGNPFSVSKCLRESQIEPKLLLKSQMAVILLCFNVLGDRTALVCRFGFIAMVAVLLSVGQSSSGPVPPEELAHVGQLLWRMLNQKQ